jgi:hypothetical protein
LAAPLVTAGGDDGGADGCDGEEFGGVTEVSEFCSDVGVTRSEHPTIHTNPTIHANVDKITPA